MKSFASSVVLMSEVSTVYEKYQKVCLRSNFFEVVPSFSFMMEYQQENGSGSTSSFMQRFSLSGEILCLEKQSNIAGAGSVYSFPHGRLSSCLPVELRHGFQPSQHIGSNVKFYLCAEGY